MVRAKRGGWDGVDVRLLDLLQVDADRTLRELGDVVGLSPSAVQRRIARYKAEGIVRTVVEVDPARLVAATQAMVTVSLVEETTDYYRDMTQRLRARPEVQQCYAVSGRWDLVVLVTVSSIAALRELGDEMFKSDENVRRFDTMVILDTVKSGSAVPAAVL